MRRLLLPIASFVALLVLWLLLWGRVTSANVLGGVLVIGFVLWIAPIGPKVDSPSDRGGIHPLSLIHFAVVFMKELIVATWQVAVLVVLPERARPGVIRVQLFTHSPRIATVVANAVTLTPGTMTIDDRSTANGIVLSVHALDASDPESIRSGVRIFERLAILSFGSREERAAFKSEVAQ